MDIINKVQHLSSNFIFTHKFSDNKQIQIYLLIDYQRGFYSVSNYKQQEEFIFSKSNNSDFQIALLDLIKDAIKFAKEELENR